MRQLKSSTAARKRGVCLYAVYRSKLCLNTQAKTGWRSFGLSNLASRGEKGGQMSRLVRIFRKFNMNYFNSNSSRKKPWVGAGWWQEKGKRTEREQTEIQEMYLVKHDWPRGQHAALEPSYLQNRREGENQLFFWSWTPRVPLLCSIAGWPLCFILDYFDIWGRENSLQGSWPNLKIRGSPDTSESGANSCLSRCVTELSWKPEEWDNKDYINC